MAKITVSKELVDQFPSLAPKLGKTVNASEVQRARRDASAPVAKTEVAKASAPKAPAKKVAKKVAKKSTKAKK